MHEATQRRLLRGAFLLLCVLPTLAVIGWAILWSLPGHTAALERDFAGNWACGCMSVGSPTCVPAGSNWTASSSSTPKRVNSCWRSPRSRPVGPRATCSCPARARAGRRSVATTLASAAGPSPRAGSAGRPVHPHHLRSGDGRFGGRHVSAAAGGGHAAPRSYGVERHRTTGRTECPEWLGRTDDRAARARRRLAAHRVARRRADPFAAAAKPAAASPATGTRRPLLRPTDDRRRGQRNVDL